MNKQDLHKVVFDKWNNSVYNFKRKDAEKWVEEQPKTKDGEGILTWAREHPYLRVNTASVPSGIFPDTLSVKIHDVGTFPPKSRRAMILDDDVYDAFPHIRTFIPRGCCILEVDDQTNKKTTFHLVVFAMKKFTGGPGDDDDLSSLLESEDNEVETERSRERFEYYFSDNVNNSKKILKTSKENGEAAHLGFFKHEDVLYFVFGSKNVHMIVRNQEDVGKYKDRRYLTANMIAEVMKKQFNPDSESKIKTFIDHMVTNNLCANFEFLNVDYQHVELFDFTQSKYRFISFSSLVNLEKVSSDDLESDVKVASEAGLETVTVESFSYEQQKELFDIVRKDRGKEGSVLYYYNDKECIGMVKKKSAWYVCLRSVREKMKPFAERVHKKEFDNEEKAVSSLKSKIRSALRQKQDWIGFDDEALEKWITVAQGFAEWMLDAVKNNKVPLEQVRTAFPVVWNQYLTEKGQSDQIDVVIDASKINNKKRDREEGGNDNDQDRKQKRQKYNNNRGGRGGHRGKKKSAFDFTN
ncbi:ATP synthase subunit atpF [Acrasis kona]|uniref:ATP synthase subunit atpF n=1 Tax=Acrasis kona TaxID=1008807 RepID=A0AAW2Z550_9EUKA